MPATKAWENFLSYEGLAGSERTYLLSVVVLSHNDSFLSSVSSSEKNHNSSRLHTKKRKVND